MLTVWSSNSSPWLRPQTGPGSYLKKDLAFFSNVTQSDPPTKHIWRFYDSIDSCWCHFRNWVIRVYICMKDSQGILWKISALCENCRVSHGSKMGKQSLPLMTHFKVQVFDAVRCLARASGLFPWECMPNFSMEWKR